MFDRDKLKQDLLNNRQFEQAKPKNGFTFTFARTSQFDQGQYPFRVCPTNVEKNPDGFVVSSRYGIERDASAPKESTKYVAMDPTKSNYTLGILHQMTKYKVLEQASPGLRESLSKLFPMVKYLFPVMVKADTYETVKDNGYKETRFKPTQSDNIVCLILEVYPESALINQLFTIAEQYDDFNDFKRGQWLLFTKKPNKNELVAFGKKSPLTEEEKALIVNDKYPSLLKIAQRDMMSHVEIVEMIQNAHWASKLEAMGVDLEDHGPLGSPYVPKETESEEEESNSDEIPFDVNLNLDL